MSQESSPTQENISQISETHQADVESPPDETPAPPETHDPRIRRANEEAARFRVERNTAREELEALQTQQAQRQAEIEALHQQLAAAEQTAQQAQRARWQLQAAAQVGLPPEMAERLQGDDPEAIAQDAARLAALLPLQAESRSGHAGGAAPPRARQIFDRIEGRSDDLFTVLRQGGQGGGAFAD